MNPATDTVLPAPSENPSSEIVIYDGHCRFCTAQVRRLARWDKRHRLSFLSLHDAEVLQRWPELSHDQLMAEMYLITPTGQTHSGASAIKYLSTKLARLWPLAPLLHIPYSLPIWRSLYKIVAKYRYRLAGSSACDGDTCQIHFR